MNGSRLFFVGGVRGVGRRRVGVLLDGQVPPKFEKESFLSVFFRGWSAVFVIKYRRKIENPDFRRYITAHKTVWRQKTTVKISEDLILAVVCLAPTD